MLNFLKYVFVWIVVISMVLGYGMIIFQKPVVSNTNNLINNTTNTINNVVTNTDNSVDLLKK